MRCAFSWATFAASITLCWRTNEKTAITIASTAGTSGIHGLRSQIPTRHSRRNFVGG